MAYALRRGWIALLLGLLMVLPCAAEPSIVNLSFGTYPSERPSEELVKMEPIRVLIEEELNAAGDKYRVEMRIFTTYEEAVDAIATGKVDFARLGPGSYIHAHRRNARIHVLARESTRGVGMLKGYIFVAEDSPIRSLKDVRGYRFAFGEDKSTTGRYMAQQALLKAGIRGKDLREYAYLGRHDKVAFAVGSGSFDAGASNEITYGKYGESKRLRPIHTLRAPTHAWVARAGLPPDHREAVTAALLRIKSPVLARIGRDGFLPASDRDFAEVREAVEQVERYFE